MRAVRSVDVLPPAGGQGELFRHFLCARSNDEADVYLPPQGRTYGDLDVLFEQRVSARNFSKTVVDQFSSAHSTDVVSGLKKRDISHREYAEKA